MLADYIQGDMTAFENIHSCGAVTASCVRKPDVLGGNNLGGKAATSAYAAVLAGIVDTSIAPVP